MPATAVTNYSGACSTDIGDASAARVSDLGKTEAAWPMRIEAITRPWHDDGVDGSAFRGMKKSH